jgi:hypothetical protein
MVFTSFDIRLGDWFQRKFAWPYEWVMRLLNRELHRVARASPPRPGPGGAGRS